MQRKQWLERTAWVFAAVLAVLWLCVFPLLLVRNGENGLTDWAFRYSYSGFTRTKRDTAWLLGAMTFVTGCLLLPCVWKRIDWKHPGRWLAIGCFLWMGLSGLYGSSVSLIDASGEPVVLTGSDRFEGLYTQLCYLAIFAAMSFARPSVRTAAIAAAVGLTGYATVTAMQYMGMNPLGLYPGTRSIYTNYEFQSTIGNIDMGVGYLCVAVPLILARYLCHGRWSGLLLPFGLVGVLLILMTEVQAGMLALVCGCGLVVLLMLHRPELRSRGLVVLALVLVAWSLRSAIGLPWLDGLEAPWNCAPRWDTDTLPQLTGGEQVIFPWNPTAKKMLPLAAAAGLLLLAWMIRNRAGRGVPKRWILAGVAVLGLGGLCVLRFANIPESMGFVWQLHEVLCGRGQDSFGSERFGVWRYTLQIAQQNLLFGTGPDTFLSVFQTYLGSIGVKLSQVFDNPHNLFLAILVQNGLPALVLYVAAIAWIILRAARTREGLPLAAAACCYLLQGMFTFSIVIVTPMFWAVLGMAVACCTREGNAKTAALSSTDAASDRDGDEPQSALVYDKEPE